jgi:predicted amino acid-binding ACT domain protein
MTIPLCQIHEDLPQPLIIKPRIKQLKTIYGRQIEKIPEVKDLFSIYYTLCSNDEEQKEFFKSNIIKSSLNPSWNPLDRLMFPSWMNIQSSDFIIKVWIISGKDNENPILLFSNIIEGELLVYIGTEITELKTEFSKNSLIFEYTNGFYIQCPECSELRKESGNIINVYKVDQNLVKKSYSANMLINLNKVQEELKKKKEELENKKKALRKKLKLYKEKHKLDFIRTEYNEESKVMENQLIISMLNIEENTRRLEEYRISNDTRSTKLDKKNMELDQKMVNLEQIKKEFENEMTQKRNQFRAMSNQRLAELLIDLLNIYPIEPSVSDPLIYTICGIPLPNSIYDGYNLDDISTALGYTCHLIIIIADYINVVLRYPIKHMSSRSTIIDPLNIECQPMNEFPLFTKKLNNNRFIYGVFLLNKNIEQLLNHIKQNVSNLKNTLPNLRKLIYKLIQLGATDSNLANEFAESASLNNKCFQQVLQSMDNDRQYFYAASSVGSSSNYFGTSNFYQYINNNNNSYYNNSNNSNTNSNSNTNNTPINKNYLSVISSINENSFSYNNSSNNSNSNINYSNYIKSNNNSSSTISPILSYSNASSNYTGVNILSSSLYSQPTNSIYSNSLHSQNTLSEINVSSTILSRSYINNKKKDTLTNKDN